MILLALLLLLITAAACLGLNHTTPTRTLGFVASGASLVAALVTLLGVIQQRETSPPPITWAPLDQITVSLSLQASVAVQVLALIVAGGGALAMFTLAVALAPTVKEFATLFAWALLAVAAALFGLTCNGLLLPFAWALAVIAGYSAVRSSGSLTRSEETPFGVATGMFACLLLTGGMLMVEPSVAGSGLPGGAAVACITAACLMLVGSAPFHTAHNEFVLAPSALGVLLYGLVLPVLGLGTLLRFAWELSPLVGTPTLAMVPSWRVPIVLVGGITMLAGAAGALREHRMRKILSWQTSSQAGAVLIALGLQSPVAAVAAPALLVNTALSTLAGALSISAVKYLTGNDDFTQGLPEKQRSNRALWLPGVLWTLAAASALGLPPLWGFWARYWLFAQVMSQAPWVLPLILGASSLSALAYVAPMARFWWPGDYHAGAQPEPLSGEQATHQTPGSSIIFALALAPLVVLGLAPQSIWQGWLHLVPGAPAEMPLPPALQVGVPGVALVVLLLLAALWRVSWVRRTPSDEDMTPVVLAPDTLAQSLLPLAWVGHPSTLIQALWNILDLVNRGVEMALSVFEQRYYLTGVILALISLILLMALL